MTADAESRNDTREQIGAIVGNIPSGLFILTASDGKGNETGMLASWVQQASFDPLALTVAVQHRRYINEWLASTQTMALSVIGESQTDLLKHFGKGFEPNEPAFEGLETTKSPSGLTVLADTLGYVEGTIAGKVDAGDHVVYVVRLSAAGKGNRLGKEKPSVHLRKSGLNY